MKIQPQPRRLGAFLTLCFLIALALYGLFHLPGGEGDEPPTCKAQILAVEESANDMEKFAPGSEKYYVTLRLDSGPDEGEEVRIVHRTLNNPAFDIHPKEGESILVREEHGSYAIVDYDRLPGVLWLLAGFALALILFGGWTGLKSLFVLLFAVLLIAKGLISLILFSPTHILLWTFLIGSLITLSTQLVVNGCNMKSAGAIVGTIGGIFVAGLLALLAIHATYLTGIAEEHAVAMASGLARGGARPIFGTYSTFFQRVYDQMAQDVAVNNNPAVFLSTYATLYGMNDVTHLGFFDIPLFANIPNLVFLAPAGLEEYLAVLRWAIAQTAHPVMIRVPVMGYETSPYPVRTDYSALNLYQVVTEGAEVAIIGAGNFAQMASDAAAELAKDGVHATVINPIFLSGLDTELLDGLKAKHRLILTLEDGTLEGGFGQKIAAYYGMDEHIRVRCYGLSKEFHDRYNPEELAREHHLTAEQIVADTLRTLKKKE